MSKTSRFVSINLTYWFPKSFDVQQHFLPLTESVCQQRANDPVLDRRWWICPTFDVGFSLSPVAQNLKNMQHFHLQLNKRLKVKII